MRRISVCLLALVIGCAGGTPWPDDLEPVAHPDLSAIEDAARGQLGAQRSTLEQLLTRGQGESLELGKAFGQMGRLYHAYGLHDPGAVCYRNAQILDPEGFLWPYYLGMLEQTEGRFAEALKNFERSLELGPDNAPAQMRLATVLLSLNQASAARERLESLVGDERFAAVAHAGLGRAANSLGESELAVQHFEKVLELAPEAGSAHQGLATALRQLDRLAEAEAHLEKKGAGEAGFPDPLAERLEALAISSGSYLRRGNQALMAGNAEQAIKAYGKAVEVSPGNVEARRNLALALVGQRKFADAMGHLEAALKLEPENVRLHFDLANTERARGGVEPAITAYQRAIELDPGYVVARFNLANTLAEQKRWGEAGQQLEEVLKLEPGHSRARYLAAMALQQQNRSDEAMARLSALVADEPTNLDARSGLASIHVASNRPIRALDVYRGALDLEFPTAERAEVLRRTAQLAWRSGQRQEALGYYRQGVELEPDSSQAHTLLANSLQLIGDHGKAIESFERAVELDPENATAWLSEASLRILAGNYTEAIDRLNEALLHAEEDVGLNHTLARLLATCPHDELRDGIRALTLAQKAYSLKKSLDHAATIAMAMAEMGRFNDAIKWQRGLINQAVGSRTQKSAIRGLQRNLALYEKGRPVRIEVNGS